MRTLKLSDLADSSIRVIKGNQAVTGAYIASPNFAVYKYSWFRGGAFIADAMLDVNEIESAANFHNWAAQVVNRRADQIHSLIAKSQNGVPVSPEEHLHCRFTVEGDESNESWTNFQLDGYGTWLWALARYTNKGNAASNEISSAVDLCVSYISEFWKQPSFDWWEESFGRVHVSSIGSICAGLIAAAKAGLLSDGQRIRAEETAGQIYQTIHSRGLNEDGSLRKWLDEDGLDGSASALISPFDLFEPSSQIAIQTTIQIQKQLGTFGTHRHLRDVYFGGGLWLILSAFLGLALLKSGERNTPQEIVNWIASQADSHLYLAEQIDADLLFPDQKQAWINKWGHSANPLLWSHAMFLKLWKQLEGIDVANS